MKKQFSIELWNNNTLLEFSRVYCVNPYRTRIYREMRFSAFNRGILIVREVGKKNE